ncbi:MAG: glycoside hydrolase family 78 protein [Candidatus Cyclobacteriaceae bacterium M3_2C_046]
MRIIFLTICLQVVLYPLWSQSDQQIWVEDLKCNYRTDPVGLDQLPPQFSWQVLSQEKATTQSAYRILVATDPDLLQEGKADLWDSKNVSYDQSVHIPYLGKELGSRDRAYWKVKVWNQDQQSSVYSQVASFELGLLEKSDWQAQWLKHPDFLDTLLEPKPAPFFRRDFVVDKTVKQARAYVTGLGYFELYLNGKKVGDHLLDPVKTRYDKTVKYLVHDITDQVKAGGNAVGLILGTGWYNHFSEAAWQFNKAPWRDYPTMICQLEITYQDGTKAIVLSDEQWKTATGPILFDGIRNGETYDARLEMPGWSHYDYNDQDWLPAVEVAGPSGKLTAQQLPAIKEMREIKPVSVKEVKPGVYVFDLGQNIAGYSRIKVAGPKGSEVKMKHGERINPDGTVEQKQILRFLRTLPAQTDQYILKGEGVEIWQPRFVYHGYQYVEVTGLPVKPTLETLTGVVIYTSFESAGDFSCSNPLFNKIQELTRWSYIGNYHGVPTDCPHREKIGWTGDGHLVTEAGLFNYDVVTSYIKWLDDFVDEQRPLGDLPGVIPTSGWGYEFGRNPETRPLGYGPQWEGAIVLIPWYLYLHTGDTAIINRYYQPIKKYIDHLNRQAQNNLLNFGIDDHKSLVRTEGDILASGYFYYMSDLLARMAQIIDLKEDAAYYEQLAGKVKQAFNRKYFDQKTGLYGHGGQTPLSEALALNLAPENHKETVLNNLLDKIRQNNYDFEVGVVGLKFLFESLTAMGQAEVVYKMVNQTDYPSYGWWIEQGANTLWQDWDGSMSLNHIMFGSVSEWYFRALAGINPDPQQPGFKHIIIKPNFIEDLQWVNADHDTPYGLVSSSWSRGQDHIMLQLEIPDNTSSTVYLPAENWDKIQVNQTPASQSDWLEPVNLSNGTAVFRLKSGNYTVQLKN